MILPIALRIGERIRPGGADKTKGLSYSERPWVINGPEGSDYLTRERYSPVRVSISILSSVLTKAGTWSS